MTATVRRWHDEARTWALLRERGVAEPPSVTLPEGVGWEGAPRESRARTWLWLRRPDRLRWEVEHEVDGVAGGITVGVKAGARYWLRHGFHDWVDTNEDRPGGGWTWTQEELLVEPAPLLGELTLEVGNETVAHGRPAVRARGRPRPLTPRLTDVLGPVADECELLVDPATGLVLYLGVRAGGGTVTALELVELTVGEPLPDELFEPLA